MISPVPTGIHTELSHYKYGLRGGKGRVATLKVTRMLTRVAVMITFFWLTK